MENIKRNEIKVPRDVVKKNDTKYRDNLLQASTGTGHFLFLEDNINKNGTLSFDPKKYFEIASKVQSASFLTTYGRIVKYSNDYLEVPIWLDADLSTVSIDDLLTLRTNGVVLNGVNINIDESILNNTDLLGKVQRLLVESHKAGFLTSVRFSLTVTDFYEIVRTSSNIGVDLCIIHSQVQYESEIEKLADYNLKFILSDEGSVQTQEEFRNIEMAKGNGISGFLLSDGLADRTTEESVKFMKASSSIIYDGKDSNEAYDIFIE